MARDPRQIEQAFRHVRRQDFLQNLKRYWFVVAVVMLVLGWAYYTVSPRHVADVVRGTAIGAHQPPSEDNSVPLLVTVRLESRAAVNVALPRGTPYKAGSSVEVAIIQRDWPPYSVSYRFIGYVD